MNKQLLSNPNVLSWQSELEMILDGKRNLTLRKLGSAGILINNYFIDTNNELKQSSIDSFFFAFDIYIDKVLKSDNPLSANKIYMLLQIINTFRNTDHYSGSSKIGYLSKVTIVLNKVFNSVNENVNKYENSFYEYCRYIYFLIDTSLFNVSRNKLVKDEVLKLLEKVFDLYNIDLSNLIKYLMIKLGNNVLEQVDSTIELKIALSKLYLADKSYINKILNNLLIELALKDKNRFNSLLKEFDCVLDSQFPSYITYVSDLKMKSLTPNADQLERLLKLYASPKEQSELFQKSMEKICL